MTVPFAWALRLERTCSRCVRHPRSALAAVILVASLSLFNLTATAIPRRTPQPTTRPAFPAIADQAHLPNAHIVTDKVISGAQPEGEASFKALQALGIKSIISVDGAKPDVEMAHQFGMRYVHLPIGYDGVTPEQGRAIAKAIDVLPGPIYLHCHHGQHRSAAAVAVACINLGTLAPEQGEEVLKTFGTGQNYRGLWKAARDARPIDRDQIEKTNVEFVEQARISDFAEMMVQLDERWERVKLTQAAGWKPPSDHPDLDPAHEVLMVQEHLHEADRLPRTASRPADFKRLLHDGEAATQSLAAVLKAQPLDTKSADAHAKLVASSCTACHKAYRD
jgi:protein tyrosine phosphatase (PTP) superfamily phosphohydrolase (DUF442 family)